MCCVFQFSLCLEDLIPVALGRYVMAIISSLRQTIAGSDTSGNSVEHLLEKMFSLFLEQTGLWSDISSLSEIKSPELSESNLFGQVISELFLIITAYMHVRHFVLKHGCSTIHLFCVSNSLLSHVKEVAHVYNSI